jgi:hypothetical protein
MMLVDDHRYESGEVEHGRSTGPGDAWLGIRGRLNVTPSATHARG